MALTHQQAIERFAKARDKGRGALLAANTRLVQRDGYYGVILHKTEIVKIYPSGRYVLNSGGYRTKTTKARINDFSPARVGAVKGLWYVNGFVFEDGMTIDDKGKPVGELKDAKSIEASKAALDREVRAYIKRFAEDAKANGLKDPGPGDCFLCGLLSSPNVGEARVDHLISHMEEDYFVPRLLLEAVAERVTGTSWQGSMNDAEKHKRIGFNWQYLKQYNGDIRRELRGYFSRRKHLLLEVFDPVQFKANRAEHLKAVKENEEE